jgi:hypothetical protein
MTIERFDGENAAWIEDELRQIYREAFAEPPTKKPTWTWKRTSDASAPR